MTTNEALSTLENLAEDRNDPIDLYKRTVEQKKEEAMEECYFCDGPAEETCRVAEDAKSSIVVPACESCLERGGE